MAHLNIIFCRDTLTFFSINTCFAFITYFINLKLSHISLHIDYIIVWQRFKSYEEFMGEGKTKIESLWSFHFFSAKYSISVRGKNSISHWNLVECGTLSSRDTDLSTCKVYFGLPTDPFCIINHQCWLWVWTWNKEGWKHGLVSPFHRPWSSPSKRGILGPREPNRPPSLLRWRQAGCGDHVLRLHEAGISQAHKLGRRHTEHLFHWMCSTEGMKCHDYLQGGARKEA